MFKLSSVLLAGAISFALSAAELKNPAFEIKDGSIIAWKNLNKGNVAVQDGVLSYTATKSKLQDSIFQGVKITPSDNMYVFTVDVDAPVAKAVYAQIKFHSKGKELSRHSSFTAKAGKSRLIVSASNENAEHIEVAIRIVDTGAGKIFKISNPKLAIGEKGSLAVNWFKASRGFELEDNIENGFTVKITSAEKLHASVANICNVKPGCNYTFEADYTGDLPKMAYLEVKLFKKGKYIARKNVFAEDASGRLVLKFNSGDSTSATVQCRVPAVQKFVGKKVTFSKFKFMQVD